MAIGSSFLGLSMIGQTLTSCPAPVNFVNYIKIENGIYDDLYATKVNADTLVDDFTVPDNWLDGTYLHAKFAGNLYSSNADFGVDNTTNIIIKRRKLGTYKWTPLFDIEVNESDDYNFIIVDPYPASGVTYEYAAVPIINGVESNYTIAECKVDFDQLVIIDNENTYRTPLDIEINQVGNNTKSSIKPFGRRYPIPVSNAIHNYKSGNISATFLPMKDREFVLENVTQYRDEVIDFLNNRQIKYVKDPYGHCWLMSIGQTITDTDNGHPYAHSLSFDFEEVGNAESNEDMNKFGFLDIGQEWW